MSSINSTVYIINSILLMHSIVETNAWLIFSRSIDISISLSLFLWVFFCMHALIASHTHTHTNKMNEKTDKIFINKMSTKIKLWISNNESNISEKNHFNICKQSAGAFLLQFLMHYLRVNNPKSEICINKCIRIDKQKSESEW